MIRVLIADDHPMLMRGLREAIDDAMGIQVSGEAETGRQTLALARSETFDVVVVDFSMPDGDGLDVLQHLRVEKPDLPVLIMSMHPEQTLAPRLLQAGAAGYISKGEPLRKVIQAIRRVADGRHYFSPEVAKMLAEAYLCNQPVGNPLEPAHVKLSEREFQVLRLLAMGNRPVDIAEILHLSPHTVSTYRSRIYRKMNFKHPTQLVRYALEHQIIE